MQLTCGVNPPPPAAILSFIFLSASRVQGCRIGLLKSAIRKLACTPVLLPPCSWPGTSRTGPGPLGGCWKSAPIACQPPSMKANGGTALPFAAPSAASAAPAQSSVAVNTPTNLDMMDLPWPRRAASKIGFVSHGRADPARQIECVAVVLGAILLDHRPVRHFRIMLHRLPGCIEGAGVFDGEIDLELLAALDHMIALHDVERFGMGRVIIVDDGLGREPDRVDHQRIAFVMPDGFAIPGGWRVLRMRHIHVDMAGLAIARIDQ